ncbi:hypothetical protein [Halorubellus sp. PRR65]|uniref:hypothetical protein n=1 Tax=Halorubellus sp. PRR65 TaxID=3098148 RepID=UPI002B25F899|nr:hypothetical protein [Halorubellus sp. PRR65]
MNRTFATGVGLTVASVLGYAAGVLASYPGRAFALTGLMIGITVAAVSAGDGS